MGRFFASSASEATAPLMVPSRRHSQSDHSDASSSTTAFSASDPRHAGPSALTDAELEAVELEVKGAPGSGVPTSSHGSPGGVPGRLVRNAYNGAVVDTSFVPALEGLRGIAVVMVVLGHMWPFGSGGFTVMPWLLGMIGVSTFFVLSGYLITGILLATQLPRFRHLPLFFANRTVRLTPALWLCVVATTAIWLHQGRNFASIKEHLVTVLLYAENQFADKPGHKDMILAHAWTLGVEEQFYLIWAFLVPLIYARHRFLRYAILGALIVGSLALRMRWHTQLKTDLMSKSLFGNLYALLLGSSLRMVPHPLPRWMRSAWALVGGSLLYVAVLFRCWLDPNSYWSPIWAPLLVSLASALIVTGSAAQGYRFLETSLLRHLGRVSYSWYLWHHVVLWLPGFFNRIDVLTVGLVLGALSVAQLSTYYVEEPLRAAFKKSAWFRRENALVTAHATRLNAGALSEAGTPLFDAFRIVVTEPAGNGRPGDRPAIIDASHVGGGGGVGVGGGGGGGMNNNDIARLGFVPSLEGLRGLAVLLPIACHIHGGAPQDFMLGSMGVTVFFVLSGFLITGVLLSLQCKYSSASRPYRHLVRFYTDRFVRLQPPLAALVLVGSVWWIHTWGHAEVMAGHALRALLNLENTRLLRTSSPLDSPFRNCWSLGVEEQFYIFWALALPLVARRGLAVRRVILFGVIATSMACRVTLGRDRLSPRGELIRTPWWFQWHESLASNLWKMMVGCAMRLVPLPAWLVASPTGYAGMALLGVGMLFIQLPKTDYTTLWSFSSDILSVLAAVLTIAGSLRGNAFLETRTLRFLGRVSYAWYLWQVPIIWLDRTWQSDYKAMTSSCFALVVATASTLLLEEPVRDRYRAWLRGVRPTSVLAPNDAATPSTRPTSTPTNAPTRTGAGGGGYSGVTGDYRVSEEGEDAAVSAEAGVGMAERSTRSVAASALPTLVLPTTASRDEVDDDGKTKCAR